VPNIERLIPSEISNGEGKWDSREVPELIYMKLGGVRKGKRKDRGP
jgi:hypothetical protein